MRRRRSELLPPDRGLQARMLPAMLVTPAAAIGGLVVFFAFAPRQFVLPMIVVTIAGLVTCAKSGDARREVPLIAPDEYPGVHAIVERLCVLADLPEPEIAIVREEQPNSWI